MLYYLMYDGTETRSGRSASSTDSERRRELLRETDRYLAELIEEIGEPPSGSGG